jgi:hypothetical protein
MTSISHSSTHEPLQISMKLEEIEFLMRKAYNGNFHTFDHHNQEVNYRIQETHIGMKGK